MPKTLPKGERHPDYEAPRPLPEPLARSLAPEIRHAMNHPTRRAILRKLIRDPAARVSPGDLQPILPGASRATIAYHAGILQDCGAVTVTTIRSERGTAPRLYGFDSDADTHFEAALAATEDLDASAK